MDTSIAGILHATPTLSANAVGAGALGIAMSPKKSLNEMVVHKWAKSALFTLDKTQDNLNSMTNPNHVQRVADDLGRRVLDLMAPLFEFSHWIDKNEGNQWYSKVAIALAKLPLQVAKLAVSTLYFILKEAVMAPFHPIDASIKLAKLLVVLAEAAIRPETYTMIGSGMLGLTASQACLGSPTSLPCLAIGAVLLISGLSVGTILAAIHAEKGTKNQAVIRYLKHQLTVAATTFVGSFIFSSVFSLIFPSMVASSPSPALTTARYCTVPGDLPTIEAVEAS